MTDKKKGQQVTQDGAVELDENQLDQASGGAVRIEGGGTTAGIIAVNKYNPEVKLDKFSTAYPKLP